MEEIGIMKKSSVRYTHSRGGMVVILLFLCGQEIRIPDSTGIH